MDRAGKLSGMGWLIAAFTCGLATVIVASLLSSAWNGPTVAATSSPTATTPDAILARNVTTQQSTTSIPRKGELYGWGSVQPYKMRATVEYGGTNKTVTPAQHEALAPMLERARAAALKIGTVAEAERQGYVKNFQRISGRGYEYLNWSYFKDKLDLDHPTMLVFADDTPTSRVVSMAYQVLGTHEAGPPKDFPLDIIGWHFHHNLCEVNGAVVGAVEYDPQGKPYASMQKRCDDLGAKPMPWLDHWMVDLWVIPGWENPWGLISSKHPDLMEEPTPWFGPQFSDGSDGLEMFCKLPDGLAAPPSSQTDAGGH